MRLVQAGQGAEPRPVVVLYLVGAAMDSAIRDALGPVPCVVADVEAPKGATVAAALAFTKSATGVEGRLHTLAGWSLGCSRVRDQLGAGARPAAVVLADGTTNEYPRINPAKAAVWRDLCDRARRWDCTFAASHTYLVYTERLRAPETPYQATVNALRAATGWALPEPDTDTPAEQHENGLHVYSYRSGDMDGAAHIAQVRHALPMMLRRHVAPLFGATPADAPAPGHSAPASASQATTRPTGWRLALGSRGVVVVALQRALNGAGASPALVEDGIFGVRTRAAVAQAQSNAGLPVDGVADAALMQALAGDVTVVDSPLRLLGLAVLRVALGDIGITETARNDGPEIRQLYLNPMRLPAGSDWCAAATTSWIRRGAANAALPAPVAGSAGAKALMAQFQAAGRFIPASKVTAGDVVPGVVAFWDRSTPGRPDTSWHGHVGIVSDHAVGVSFRTCEANSGATGKEVAAMVRRLDDPKFLGIGLLD